MRWDKLIANGSTFDSQLIGQDVSSKSKPTNDGLRT